jgi:hypothetical protein
MFDGQMEMSFGQAERMRRQHRQSRARWWFQRMRQVVDRAALWQPIPPARPVQIWFSTSDRVNGNPVAGTAQGTLQSKDERQMCE